MSAQTLHFYLPSWLHGRVDRPGTIFAHVAAAARAAGWDLALHGEEDPPASLGYHLLYNRAVLRPDTLVLRKCGFEPFYRIEATNDRWDWGVAKADFETEKGGEWFRTYWRDVLFKDQSITQGGYAFMPLQGRLLKHRHFQFASPAQMIEMALKSDADRPIKATLHPRENYSAPEIAALDDIAAASHGRFEISTQPSLQLLAGCDYVVTQNSTLALIGMFAQKTPILFADIDFHHLAGAVGQLGLDRAYKRLNRPRRWGAYLHWYFKENAISEHDDHAPQMILKRLNDLGWPMQA